MTEASTPNELEQIPLEEPGALAIIIAEAERRVRKAAEHGPARRDAHPKSHGTVKATFRVLDTVPSALRAGVFAEPREFEAWIRFSNGAEKPAEDGVGDGRGMAIKLLGVAGSPSGTQDFLQINYPVFFVRDAADYLAFTTAQPNWRFFIPGINPLGWRLREAWIGLQITRQPSRNPLDIRYFTMTPLLCGSVPVKASSRPLPPPSVHTGTGGPNFLRANMAAHLAEAPARFEFMLQAQVDPRRQPIEDPRIVWDEAAAPFVPVAHIHIPPQRFDTPEGNSFGENLSFTPWHCLPEHRPIGGINRVRRTVYEAISRLRHDINNVPREEPVGGTAAPQGEGKK
jgi:Catalase